VSVLYYHAMKMYRRSRVVTQYIVYQVCSGLLCATDGLYVLSHVMLKFGYVTDVHILVHPLTLLYSKLAKPSTLNGLEDFIDNFCRK
jgi:hypothetical protein